MTEDRKSLIIGGVALAVLLLFIVFVYIPRYRAVSRLGDEIEGIDKQIRATEEMAGDIRNLGMIIASMQKEVDTFESRLPATDEVSSVLSECSDIAKQYSVEVISIISEDPVPFLDSEGRQFVFGDSPVKTLQISFRVRGTYRNLAEYCRNIHESTSMLATLDEIEVDGDEDIAPLLDAKLAVSAFVVDRE